jgi:vancomycin resistance protein YoaR
MEPKKPLKSTWPRQILSAILLGMGVIFLLTTIFTLAILGIYHNRVLPGVTLNGNPLSGMTYDEAAGVISSSYSFPQSGHIILKDGENNWTVTPVQLGVSLNADASAQNALMVGRSGSLFTRITDTFAAVFFGYSASPTFLFDENAALQYLTNLAGQIDQPLKNAGLKIESSEVITTQGQPGRALDIPASLANISSQVRKMQDGVVVLTIIEEQPEILDVSQQGEQVKEMLSQPLVLTLPSEQSNSAGPWTVDPVDLAKTLTFTQVADGGTTKIAVMVNRPVMAGYLNTIKNEVDLQPQNARFIFNDDTRQLDLYKPAVIGRALDIDKSVTAINEALLQGSHAAELQLTLTQPAVSDTSKASELGITELVEQQVTYFRGSSSERVQNIQTGAERFKGLLIAPGEEVSMSDILGDISLDNGYAEAPIILDDQTIQGVGGGICQVSTTLFRTALHAGFPINERHAHSYRVGYYEQTASGHDSGLAGMDATVFVPIVDLKFTNDTTYWLLMETYVNTSEYRLTWKFYSTSDGREVSISTPEMTDIVEPPDPLYRENPDLPTGVKKQVEYAADGATVSFDRTVSRDGEVIDNNHFVTHYEVWQAVYEYGPGTEGIPTPTPEP